MNLAERQDDIVPRHEDSLPERENVNLHLVRQVGRDGNPGGLLQHRSDGGEILEELRTQAGGDGAEALDNGGMVFRAGLGALLKQLESKQKQGHSPKN